AGAKVSGAGGSEVNVNSITVTSSNITINITVTDVGNISSLTISGIQVQATEGGALPSAGSIYRATANPGTATLAGIGTTSNTDGSGGTSFCSLSQTVGALRMYVVLPGRTFTDASTLAASGLTGTITPQTAGIPFNI